MNHIMHKYLLLVILIPYAPISAISMVYNFRIAQVTRQPIVGKPDKRNNMVVLLPFEQYRHKRSCINQNYAGGLGSYIRDFGSNYFRIDGAFSHIHEETNDVTTFSGIETDDILFTAGHNFEVSEKTSMTLSGLLGIPTHKIYRLKHADFGYSQVGTGIQLDGSSSLHHGSAVIYGARYIYFVPRNACDTEGEKYKFTLGNIGDVLLAYKHNWNKHGIELGFTERFRLGARICPNFDEIVKKTNYIRSNFYFIYKYRFWIRTIANRLLFNISYGTDHVPKRFGNQYIITLWASWNINF